MSSKTVTSLVSNAIESYQDRIFCIERKRFRRITWTYNDLHHQANLIASLLQTKHLQQGDTVGICAQNGPWWLATYIACLRLGIVVVPIDLNSSKDFINKVADKTNLKLLFKTVYKPLGTLGIEAIELEQLSEILQEKLPKPQYPKIKTGDVLEIVFTSGSTGDPKGVVLTQGNIASNVLALKRAWLISKNHRLLSMIPLSHMFEQTVGFLVPFVSGSSIVYVESVRPYQIVKAMQAESITTIVTVPAFLTLLRRRIMEKMEASRLKPFLDWELKYARFMPRTVRRYMFQAVYVQLCQTLNFMVVGGAPLPKDLEVFWETIGIRVVQGYGLTETAPIATYNSPQAHKPGSVGRCLPGQRLKLADDGEILLAGDNVFQGYFDNDAETSKVLADGWFHTGDIGRIDKNGYLFITGRKKNMLLSQSGLNIYPEDIETQIAAYTDIKDSVVMLTQVGGKEVLTAVVLTDITEAELAKLVQFINKKLASHQTIQRAVIWPDVDFPRTPTRKIKRQLIVEQLSNDIKIPGEVAEQEHQNFSALKLLVANVAGVAPNKITATTNLLSDLGFDSLKRLELVSKIEEELGAFLQESSVNADTDFEALTALVQAKTNGPGPKPFSLSPFESRIVSNIRVILQLPLLWWARLYQKLQGDKLKTTSQPVIFIANHTSHFDVLTILRLLPLGKRRGILMAAAKDYFFKNRFQAFLLRLFLPLIPLDRDGNIQDSLERIGNFIDQGYSVVLFPEGTRSKTGDLLPFKNGIGVIAQELEVPIVTLRFKGNDKILPKGKRWPRAGITSVSTTGEALVFGKDGDYSQTTLELEKVMRDL